MFFGTDDSEGGIFADFGFDIAPQQNNPIFEDRPSEDTPIFVDVSGEPLRQLTLRPVAGYVVVVASSSAVVRYAENGTGHIYEIDLQSGAENRISGTTIPRVTEAYFSSDGSYVALVSEVGYSKETFFGRIESDTTGGAVVGRSLPVNANNISVGDNVISYSITTPNGTDLFTYTGATETPTRTASVPLRDVHVYSDSINTFIQPKPSALLEGSLYQLTNQDLLSVTPSEFGFTSLVAENHYVVSAVEEKVIYGTSINKDNQLEQQIAITPLPEKCVVEGDTMWCAAPLGVMSADYLENWYKGATESTDLLWEVNLANGLSTTLIDLFETTNRMIDAQGVSKASTQLYFINKLDGTLWQYDLTTS